MRTVLKISTNLSLQYSFRRKQILNSNLDLQGRLCCITRPFNPESLGVPLVVMFPKLIMHSQVGHHSSDQLRFMYINSQFSKPDDLCYREKEYSFLGWKLWKKKYSFTIEIITHSFNLKGLKIPQTTHKLWTVWQLY